MKARMRRLSAEPLEARQVLHGGGFGAMMSPPAVDQMVENVFERHDTTEDGVLDEADELTERLTDRLAGADSDGDGGVSTDELTVFYQTERVSKLLGLGDESGGRCGAVVRQDPAERVEWAIEVVDDDGEGDIDQTEVSAGLWEQIAAADEDGNSSLSSEELVALVETLDAERLAALVADKVDNIFSRYDSDGDDSIVEAEVTSARQWNRLSAADGNDDAAVSRDELTSYVTQQVENAEPPAGRFGGFGGHGGGHHHGHGRH